MNQETLQQYWLAIAQALVCGHRQTNTNLAITMANELVDGFEAKFNTKETNNDL